MAVPRLPHAPRISPSTKWLAVLCALLDCVGGAAVVPWPDGNISAGEVHVLQIELIVNERPAVAAMRLAAKEAPEYHIVAFDQQLQHFSHLVLTGGDSYRFTSINGGYTPSGNETIRCTVESSGEPAQVAGGLLNGLTISQLSQQLFGGHPGISVVEVTPLPSKAFFKGCVVADIPDGGSQPPQLPPNSSTAPGQLVQGGGLPGLSVELSFASELESMTWPLVHDGGYCSSYKAFEGSSGLWSHLSGEGEAKVLCAADKDCTGIVQYTSCCGSRHFFACAGHLDGSSMNAWSAVRTFAKPAVSDAVPGDRFAHSALITAKTAAAASAGAPTASSYSPGADPTVGWLGPFLVVMLTYDGTVGYKGEDEIRHEFLGDANSDTGYADMVDEASWGQYKLRPSDVDFITMDAGNTDPIDFSIYKTEQLVTAHQTYKDQIGTRTYKRTLVFEPNQPQCGGCFRATAYVPGSFSRYRGGGQEWQTIAHELGHNEGLKHSGACSTDSRRKTNGYYQYSGHGSMSFGQPLSDFTAPNRLKLGWMGPKSVVTYDAATGGVQDWTGASVPGTANVSALNLGPAMDRHLLLKIPCPTCTSAWDRSSHDNGNVYVSFRGDDAAGSTYGVDSTMRGLKQFEGGTCTNRQLRLMTSRVHVHYQRITSQIPSELWKTLGEGESYEIAGAAMVIHVCTISRELDAVVTVGADSVAAKALCSPTKPWPPTSPPSPPALPPAKSCDGLADKKKKTKCKRLSKRCGKNVKKCKKMCRNCPQSCCEAGH